MEAVTKRVRKYGNDGVTPVYVDVEAIEYKFPLILHESIDKPGTYTISHLPTGAAVVMEIDLDSADEIFDEISVWEEWQAIKSIADGQVLRNRIREVLRRYNV